jgi:hypothetical protein
MKYPSDIARFVNYFQKCLITIVPESVNISWQNLKTLFDNVVVVVLKSMLKYLFLHH